MSRTDAQAQVNNWMQARQVYLDLGLTISALVCFNAAKRICAEFKIKRAC